MLSCLASLCAPAYVRVHWLLLRWACHIVLCQASQRSLCWLSFNHAGLCRAGLHSVEHGLVLGAQWCLALLAPSWGPSRASCFPSPELVCWRCRWRGARGSRRRPYVCAPACASSGAGGFSPRPYGDILFAQGTRPSPRALSATPAPPRGVTFGLATRPWSERVPPFLCALSRRGRPRPPPPP